MICKLSPVLFIVLICSFLTLPAKAELLSTETIVDTHTHQAKIDLLRKSLLKAEVRATLIEHGVTPQQVEKRLNSMTESEIQHLANRIDELPAGGDAGTVVTILIIAVILEIFGITDLFTFL